MKKLSRREKEKKARAAEIITAAEKLFYKYGFTSVSMDQIAEAAEFTKRTLYQYFDHKEDLFFAVALKGFKQLFNYCMEALQKGRNGFEKIRLGFMAYYRFSKDFPEAFKLMNQVGYVKTKANPQRKEWLRFDNYLFQELAKVIKQGQTDGSIRNDLDDTQTAYIIAFITTGFFQQLAETGRTFTEHFQLDLEEFCRLALDLLSDALKPLP